MLPLTNEHVHCYDWVGGMSLRLFALIGIATLCLMAPFEALAGQPSLVKLPKLKPIKGATQTEQNVTSRLAILDLATGASIKPNMARRIAIELAAAVKRVGRFKEVITIAEMMNALPLEVQERLTDCSSPSCLIELGAALNVVAIVTPRLTLEPGGYRLDLDYMDLGVEARWRRGARGLATERDVVQRMPALVGSLWGAAIKPKPLGTGQKQQFVPMKNKKLARWASVLVSVGGLAIVGSSYMVVDAAQEEYEPATATANDYDQLASAQTQARIMWGAGLALTGAGIAGFSLLGR